MLFFEISIFLLFFLSCIVAPGALVLQKVKELKKIELMILSPLIGIVFFIPLTLIIRMLQLPFQLLYLYGALSVFWFLKSNKRQPIKIPRFTLIDTIGIALLLITVIVQTIVHTGSGFTRDGLYLGAERDTLWRISVAQELKEHFPPQVPGFAGVQLKNYHFFYDLLIAAASKLTTIDAVTIYTRYFSVLSSILFVGTIYLLISYIVKNRVLRYLTTIIAIWCGNLSYILPYLSKNYTFIARSNIFMSDAPFDQGHNPFNLLAYAFCIGAFILFYHFEKTQKKQFVVLLSLLIGVLTGLKIYAAIVLLGGWSLLILYRVIVTRKIEPIFLLPYLCVLPAYLLIKGENFGILAFNPGWLLTKMVEDRDRLFLPDFVAKKQAAVASGNSIKISYYIALQLLMYLIGNISIRLIALTSLFKPFMPRFSKLFLLGSALTALIFPLLFSQNRAPYDSIQFTPYALLFFGVIAAFAIETIYNWTSKHTSAILGMCIVIFILALAIPTNLYHAQAQFRNGRYLIPADEIEALRTLKKNTNPDEIILTDVGDEMLSQMYVSALSGRRTFLTGKTLAQQLGIDTSVREAQVRQFYSFGTFASSEMSQFLSDHHISYIYLSKNNAARAAVFDFFNMPRIQSSENAQVYQASIDLEYVQNKLDSLQNQAK